MGNRDKKSRNEKKPKKDAKKPKAGLPPVPTAVEVVKKKRKEASSGED